MSILDFAVKFFQDSGVAIYFSIADHGRRPVDRHRALRSS